MGDSINYGISGNVQATNVAVGPQAQIIVHGDGDGAALAERLNELLRAAELDGREEVTSAVNEVAAELRAPSPDTGRLERRIVSLTSMAGAASTVAATATALLELAKQVL